MIYIANKFTIVYKGELQIIYIIGGYKMKKINPFDECPVYETKNFIFRLVNEKDAEDLFTVYTDPITLKHENRDGFSGEWNLNSSDELKNAWQTEYKNRQFVRWSIISKDTSSVIGTIEIAPLPWGKWFFGTETPVGILRLDLLSSFEKQAYFSEIIYMMATELAYDFEVTKIIMKAPSNQPERVNALILNQFYPDTNKEFLYDDYYIRINTTV